MEQLMRAGEPFERRHFTNGKTATWAVLLAAGLGLPLFTGAALAGDTCVSSGGSVATATGPNAWACGNLADAPGPEATAAGYRSAATGSYATAYGASSLANAAYSTAIGNASYAAATFSTAMGTNSVAYGVSSSAFGESAKAWAANSTALGQGSTAGFDNTVAIGAGVHATRANQVTIGGGGNTYTLAGLASPASNAAQSGSTFFVTTDSAGNLGTASFDPASIAALDGRVAGLESEVGSINRYARDTRREARGGIAAAMSMTSAPMPSAPGRTSWATNYANFKGSSGFGAAVAYRLDTTASLALTAGYSYGGEDNHGFRVGMQGEF